VDSEEGRTVTRSREKGKKEETHLQAKRRSVHRLPPPPPVSALPNPREPVLGRVVSEAIDKSLVEGRVLSGERLHLATRVVLGGIVALYKVGGQVSRV
jgi:hypothetical protein